MSLRFYIYNRWPHPHSEGVPGAHPLRSASLYQLALSSDLCLDPLLKINFNLFLTRLSPPKNSRQHYQPLTETCLLFYGFSRKLRVTRRGIIFRENWVPSVSQHYSFNNFYQHTEM